MKLTTFGISFKEENLSQKYELLKFFDDGILQKDLYWFFALHPKGITLRCSPNKTKKIIKELKKRKIKYKKDNYFYEPFKHEYYGPHLLRDEAVLIFHALSVALIRHTPRGSYGVIIERLNHMFVNMCGIHDFYQEANIYLDLAEGRFRIIGKSLPIPKFLYKAYLKIKTKFWL